jgi:hypothetical protein
MNDEMFPDHAQHTPAFSIPAQPDFYYERDRIPGVCIFIDDPLRDDSDQAERDRAVREELKDQGFRVVSIRSWQTIASQIFENIDIFDRH